MNFLLDHDVPEDVVFALEALGHGVTPLRLALPVDSADDDVLRYAAEHDLVLMTCNRDDFLDAAERIDHSGIIVLIRRRTRAPERAALVRLLDSADEVGIRNNINFA